MSKKIIICCDGTWNKRETNINGTIYPTNVVKIMRALKTEDDSGSAQVVYYDSGVGTAGLWDKFAGGAFGVGISHHIKRAYRFIANNYAPGDDIYCFGFSRGAYTVRSLSGLIGCVGLLEKDRLEHLPAAYKYYRTHPEKRRLSKLRRLAVAKDEARRHVPISFMGVWDTVGAVGIPLPILKHISKRWVGFHNVELSGNIKYAYQALAVNEQRHLFAPAIWTTLESKHQVGHEKPLVLQVWFPGVHSNVGGGYPCSGLSDAALRWMIDMARDKGIAFDENYLHTKLDAEPLSGTLEDSFTLLYRVLCIRRRDRAIGRTGDEMNERMHEFVWQRMDESVDGYAPGNAVAVRGVRMKTFKKRALVRTEGRWHGKVIVDGRSHECHILDISNGGGAKLQASVELAVGTSVGLESIPSGESSGRIVWSEKGLVGVHFLN